MTGGGVGPWERIEEVFRAALERSEEDRQAFLEETCGEDVELKAEVELMLEEHARDSSLLDTPIGYVEDVTDEVESLEDTHLGAYRVVRALGTGGMGRVYVAIHEGEGFQRTVALKVIRRGMDTDEILRRFRLERRILASLSHPHIAQLIDGGATDDGRPYFVMEHVDGMPIDTYCDTHALPVSRRLELFRLVCDAVQHAHQNLVVHRDLKPGNILVTPDGTPKLLDFGIGKLTAPDEDATDSLTRTGVKMLTPEYAAPEQILGEPVNAATDVYGLGLLLYELLAGVHPYTHKTETAVELEKAILRSEPTRPSTVVTPPLRRALSGDLDVIVLKALRREPERRYASVSALSEDIHRHLQGRPVHARPDTLRYRAGKFARRNPIPLAAAAVVFAALAGSTAYTMVQSRRVAEERDKALEVQTFLLETFGAAAPDRAGGNPVTARALLDQQAKSLERTYADDPLLRADMTAVVAEGYDRLGLFAEAEPLARAALDLRREGLPADHPDVAASVGLLGWVLHESGDSEAGERLLREALAIRRGGDEDPAGLSRTLNDLGVVREARGDYEEAAMLYDEALALRRRHFGEGHRAFATTASNLSVIHYRRGDYDAATSVATQALEAMRASVGPDHQRSIVIQSNLAAFALARGDVDAAATQYADLVDRQGRLQGPSHPVTLRVRESLAATLIRQERWEEAERELRSVIEIRERNDGPTHRDLGPALSRLGTVLTRVGRPDEGLDAQTRALAIARAAYGDVHRRVAETLTSLADTRDRLGHTRTAMQLLAEAVSVLDEVQGSDHPNTATVRARLALHALLLGEAPIAYREYAAAVSVLEAASGASSTTVHSTRLRYSQAALASGHPAEADSLLAVARAGFEAGGATEGHRALADSLAGAIGSAAGN